MTLTALWIPPSNFQQFAARKLLSVATLPVSAMSEDKVDDPGDDDDIIIIPKSMFLFLVAEQMKNIGKSQKEINGDWPKNAGDELSLHTRPRTVSRRTRRSGKHSRR